MYLRATVNRATSLLALAVGLSACSRQAPTKSYDLVVHVEADPAQPLAGAKLLHSGTTLGTTDADGLVAVRATGNEGERLELEVACPPGYRSPEAPLSVTLRRAAERPEYFAACPPLSRKLVVATRLEHGANLPIRYLGRELARSDAAGVAHLVIEAESDKTIEIIAAFVCPKTKQSITAGDPGVIELFTLQMVSRRDSNSIKVNLLELRISQVVTPRRWPSVIKYGKRMFRIVPLLIHS